MDIKPTAQTSQNSREGTPFCENAEHHKELRYFICILE
jgi:hypothetical protein